MQSHYQAGMACLSSGKVQQAERYLRSAARMGDAAALFQLGNCVLAGTFRVKDKATFEEIKAFNNAQFAASDAEIAFGHYKCAADKNHINAAYTVGLSYFFGLGVKKHVGTALFYLKKAADSNLQRAQSFLGYIYLKGTHDISKAEKLGITYLQSAANRNHLNEILPLEQTDITPDRQKANALQCHLRALYDLGVYYSKKSNIKTAFEYFSEAANKGHAPSQHQVGLAYLNGSEVEKNGPTATNYFYTAYKNGHLPSLHQIALIDLDSAKTQQDPAIGLQQFKSANDNLKIASDQGYAESQFILGMNFLNGWDGKIEPMKDVAVKYFQLAADQNHAEAQNALGNAYFNGVGVKENHELAIKYYKQAAHNDCLDSYFALGTIYLNGVSVPKNVDKAIKYLDIAESNDHIQASYVLGKLYIEGIDIEQDIKLGLEYLELAADDNDHADACYFLASWYYYEEKNQQKALEYCIKVPELCSDILLAVQNELGSSQDNPVNNISSSLGIFSANSQQKRKNESEDDDGLNPPKRQRTNQDEEEPRNSPQL